MTRGEQFAGVTVAIVTPFTQRRNRLGRTRQTRGLARRAGDRLPRPVRHHRRVAHARPRRARAGRRVRLRAGPRPHQGHGRHRVELHARSDPHDEGRQAGRGRRHPAGRAVLQQADPGGVLPPLRGRRRGRGPAHRLYNIPGRTGSNILPETIARMAEKCPHARGRQGGDRLARPGVARSRPCATSPSCRATTA